MRKGFIILLTVIMLLSVLCISPAEERTGIAAKVMTRKGPLKLRMSASEKSRVLDEIPNGTCILVEQEEDPWCCVSYRNQRGYCKTEFLVLYREADLSILDYRVLKTGDKGEDVLADVEGCETIRNMAANMAFMIKSIRAGKEHFGKPDVKHTQFFNFIR